MKVLFLDLDGVLKSAHGYSPARGPILKIGKMRRLRRIVLYALHANIPTAAAPTFHNISLFRRETRGEHITDLAGNTAQFFRQQIALQLRLAVFGLF